MTTPIPPDEEIEALIERLEVGIAVIHMMPGVTTLLTDSLDALRSLSARNRAMREAAEPFANHANWYDDIAGGYPDERVPTCWSYSSTAESKVTIGDFRRLRTALSEQTTKPVETNNGTH